MNREDKIKYLIDYCNSIKCENCKIRLECHDYGSIKSFDEYTDNELNKCLVNLGVELSIKIKYLRDVDKIEKIAVGDWIDLRAAEEIELKAGEYKMIPLGVAMELPTGYEALVAPRSSTFKKYAILSANSIGVIDESYCGDGDEWNFLAYAIRDTVIPKNERICQFRIIRHQPHINLVEVETLGNVNRGGVGSTGRL